VAVSLCRIVAALAHVRFTYRIEIEYSVGEETSPVVGVAKSPVRVRHVLGVVLTEELLTGRDGATHKHTQHTGVKQEW